MCNPDLAAASSSGVADDGRDLASAVALGTGAGIDPALPAAPGTYGFGGLRCAWLVLVAWVSFGHDAATREGGGGLPPRRPP